MFPDYLYLSNISPIFRGVIFVIAVFQEMHFYFLLNYTNISKIVNPVQCHSYLSDHYDGHELRFSIFLNVNNLEFPSSTVSIMTCVICQIVPVASCVFCWSDFGFTVGRHADGVAAVGIIVVIFFIKLFFRVIFLLVQSILRFVFSVTVIIFRVRVVR